MLESMRKSGASIFIYLIFGLLIVIFVLNFAPNAGQGGGGCGVTQSAMTVNGEKTSQSAYKLAYSGNGQSGRNKVYVALDLLVRRELLAQAADERGLRVTSALVDEEIKAGYFFLGGQRIALGQQVFDEVDGDRYFNFGKLKGFVTGLNVSMNAYKEEQQRGLQAALMAELITDSAQVSREEALANYLFENSTVTYDAVSFTPAAYRDAMRLTEADLQRFVASHEADVKKKFADEERTFKATKPALKLRSIFIAKAEPAAADAGSAAAPAPAERTLSIDDAKAKLEAARAAISAGKQTFADAAKALATDENARAMGGELGWRTADNAQVGEKAVSDAVKELKAGEMTPVIATEAGAYLVIAEERREGDLTYDQVKTEIARELALDVWSKEAAKRAALEALAAARAGTGKSLDQLFERDGDTKTGALEHASADVLAAWDAQDEAGSAATGGGGASPAAGSAAPAPTTATAAGSAAPAATAPPAPAVVAAPAALAPSTDVLPAFGTVAKPTLASFGPTPRQKQLPVVGDSVAAIEALFNELTPGMVGAQVYESTGSFALLQLKDKIAPKVDEFDKVADDKVRELRTLRGQVALARWLKDRCEAAAKAKHIKPLTDLIREFDDNGKPLPTVYRPCMTLN